MGLNINKVNLLPVWCITDKYPAFYDTESATAIEQTAKLYGAMRTLQEEYNNMATNVNATITAFITDVNADQEEFENKITKIIHDYIAMIDEKIKMQDSVIAEAVKYMKDNISKSINELLKQMQEMGELDTLILNSFNSLDIRVKTLENIVPNYEYNEISETLTFNNIIGGGANG